MGSVVRPVLVRRAAPDGWVGRKDGGMKLRSIVGIAALVLGFLLSQAPVHRSMADIAPCTNCNSTQVGGTTGGSAN